jgi:ankyrin repeat protein
MHHACALQRSNLVQLYLSCLDFNIEAQDCEGNTCLHYVAITGNLKNNCVVRRYILFVLR